MLPTPTRRRCTDLAPNRPTTRPQAGSTSDPPRVSRRPRSASSALRHLVRHRRDPSSVTTTTGADPSRPARKRLVVAAALAGILVAGGLLADGDPARAGSGPATPDGSARSRLRRRRTSGSASAWSTPS